MKLHFFTDGQKTPTSPSLGREWIEIIFVECYIYDVPSPSLGREWIEILGWLMPYTMYAPSPSLGREWIEIKLYRWRYNQHHLSPSLGREWIEITGRAVKMSMTGVSLLGEGVD